MKVYKPKRTLQIIVAAIAAVCLLFILIAPYADVMVKDENRISYLPSGSSYAPVFTALSNGSSIWITVVIFAAIVIFVGAGSFNKLLSRFTGWVSVLALADWIVMFAIANTNSGPFGRSDITDWLQVHINWVFWIGLPLVLVLCVFAFIAQFSMHKTVDSEEGESWGAKAAREAEKEREKKRAAELAEEAARKAAKNKQ